MSSTIPLAVPFKILIDSMEKHPFSFTEIYADADQDNRELIVKCEWRGLGVSNGDYTIEGHQPDPRRNADQSAARVAIERKSIDDCIGTILGFADRRPRFERELETLSSLDSAVVIVEGSMGAVMDAVEEYGQRSRETNVKSLFRSWISFQQDYSVPWAFCDSRRLAEIYCFRWLERFHRKYGKR